MHPLQPLLTVLNQWLKLKETESLRKAQILRGWCKNSTEKQIKMLQSDPSPKFMVRKRRRIFYWWSITSEKAQKNILLSSTSLLQKVPCCGKTERIHTCTQPTEKAWYQQKDVSHIHQVSVQLVSHNLKLWWKLNFKLMLDRGEQISWN